MSFLTLVIWYNFFNLDLKLKDVELVETYYKWTRLLEKMTLNQCHGCIKLEEHIKLAKDIKKHKEEVDDLRFKISDEALQQMPDFQGRVHFSIQWISHVGYLTIQSYTIFSLLLLLLLFSRWMFWGKLAA